MNCDLAIKYRPGLKSHRHYAFAWEMMPDIGDEIGVFSLKGELIGHAIYEGGNTGIIISGDDHHTDAKEATSKDEEFSIFVWSSYSNIEKPFKVIEWVKGDEFYEDNKISIAGKMKEQTPNIIFDDEFVNCYPNPTNSFTEIQFGLMDDANIELKLFDTNGKLIEIIERGYFKKGIHSIKYETSILNCGMFLIYLSTESGTSFSKLVIQK